MQKPKYEQMQSNLPCDAIFEHEVSTLIETFYMFNIFFVPDKFFNVQKTNFNPLPDMPILGSSNSKATKDMVSKTWTNGDTII